MTELRFGVSARKGFSGPASVHGDDRRMKLRSTQRIGPGGEKQINLHQLQLQLKGILGKSAECVRINCWMTTVGLHRDERTAEFMKAHSFIEKSCFLNDQLRCF